MQKLVFETPNPQVDLSVDMSGMNADEAAEYMRNWRERWSPRNINLGCGPEPANVDVDAVRASVAELMAVKANTPTDMNVVGRAERSRAFFYWRYATALAYKQLKQTKGEAEAERLSKGEDRTEFCALRIEKMRGVMKDRFGIDMDAPVDAATSAASVTDAPASTDGAAAKE